MLSQSSACMYMAMDVQCALQDALTGGWFRSPDGTANLPVVVSTAAEIASGMSFLHSRGIVHGDLSSGEATALLQMVQVLARMVAYLGLCSIRS